MKMKKISNLKLAIEIYERKIICEMLRACNWNVAKAAKSFDIGVSSLYRKITQYKIRKQRNAEKEEM